MLRRGQLAPLPDSSEGERELQTEEPTEEPFSTIFISPCQIKVSNDPFQDNDAPAAEEVLPCNRTTYECPLDNANQADPLEYQVNFDFEVHYLAGTSLERSLNELEDMTLQHLAVLADLFDCDGRLSTTSAERSGGSRYLQSILSDEYRDALVGISSEPPDTVDPDYDECIVPVEGLSANTICAPVKGSLTMLIDADSSVLGPVEAGVRGSILDIVRQAMIADTYVIENVEKVSYIGTRAEQAPVGTPDGLRDSLEGGNDLTPTGIAFIAVAVGGIVSLTLFGMFAARNRRRNVQMEDVIFHDATVEAQNARELQQKEPREAGWNSNEYLADTSDNRSLEGADIPGSMANSDALALQPDPYGHIKTGDFETGAEETVPTSYPTVEDVPAEYPDTEYSPAIYLATEYPDAEAGLAYADLRSVTDSSISDNQSYMSETTDGDAGSSVDHYRYVESDMSDEDESVAISKMKRLV